MVARKKAWKKLMVPLRDHWMKKFDAQSKKEGWAIFEAGGRLALWALDDPDEEEGWPELPGGDAEALDLVSKKAAEGSKMHILALFLDGQSVYEDGEEVEVFVPKFLLT